MFLTVYKKALQKEGFFCTTFCIFGAPKTIFL